VGWLSELIYMSSTCASSAFLFLLFLLHLLACNTLDFAPVYAAVLVSPAAAAAAVAVAAFGAAGAEGSAFSVENCVSKCIRLICKNA
jgi:hypothetical protein